MRLLPALLWMLGIFVMSAQSAIPQAPSLPASLTAVAGHLVAYAILAVLISIGIQYEVRSFKIRAMAAVLVSTIYGISDEFHQSFVPGRHASVLDVITDATGAAIGVGLLFVFIRVRQQRRAPA